MRMEVSSSARMRRVVIDGTSLSRIGVRCERRGPLYAGHGTGYRRGYGRSIAHAGEQACRTAERRRLAGGGALAECHRNVVPVGAAHDGDRHPGAGREIGEYAAEVTAGIDGLAVDGNDDVAFLDAGGLCGTLARRGAGEVGDEHAALHGQIVAAGRVGWDVLPADAEEALPRVGEVAILHELTSNELESVGRDGEA